MSEEEYLRACGWEPGEDDAGEIEWTHERRPSDWPGRLLKHTTDEAVEDQLAEDRARYNFVRARSWMNGGLLVPIPALEPKEI
jgi:hypothetical protein